jgi:hypothetical protein
MRPCVHCYSDVMLPSQQCNSATTSFPGSHVLFDVLICCTVQHTYAEAFPLSRVLGVTACATWVVEPVVTTYDLKYHDPSKGKHTQFHIGHDFVIRQTQKEEKAYHNLIHTVYNVVISKSPDTAMWSGTSQQAGQGTLQPQGVLFGG